MSDDRCAICRGREADPEMGRVQVWENEHWRLSTSIGPGDPTPGFSYLEPKRHIPHITDLDGEEAASFGAVISRCTRALRRATQAELVYVYIFGGGIPHLHVHLAPHRAGDALNEAVIKGAVEERALESGATAFVSKDYPPVPEHELREVAERVRLLLAGPADPGNPG